MSGELRKYRALALALIATVVAAVLLFAQFLRLDLDRNRERLAAQVVHATLSGEANARFLIERLEMLARLYIRSDVPDARLRSLAEASGLSGTIDTVCLHEDGAVRPLIVSDAAAATTRCAPGPPDGSAAVAIAGHDDALASELRIVRSGADPLSLEFRTNTGRARGMTVTVPAERLLEPYVVAANGNDAPLDSLCLSLRVGGRFHELACRDTRRPIAPEPLVHPMPSDTMPRLIEEIGTDGLRWQVTAVPDYRALARHVPLLPFAVLGIALAIGAAACVFTYSTVGRTLELEAQAGELRVLLEKLEEQNQQNQKLDQFAAMAAHDLQAPIRFVVSGAHTLNMELDGLGRPDLSAIGRTLIEQGERMRALILDLLEFCRAGQAELTLEPVNIAAVVDDEIGLLKAHPDYAGTRFAVGRLPTALTCDASKFSQIIRNLIGNAVKFSQGRSPPQVAVSARRHENLWTFRVEDNGPGVRAEHRERIFLPFNRLDRHTEGTGMGLAIVKKLVERHGGAIWLSSDCSTAGSAFCFTLPGTRPENTR